MRVALYMRRSTNEKLQAHSLEIQEEILRAYADREGHTVVKVYHDSASGRSTQHRDGFNELIEAVRGGAPFEAILVRDVSRWGRFLNVDESAYWEFVCVMNHVRVIYVEESFGAESPTTTLMKALERWKAAEYSLERGRLTKKGRAHSVRSGFSSGTPCPYALRRVLVDRDGSYIQDLAKGERKLLSTQHVKLAPGPPEEVMVVRTIFEMYRDGWVRTAIAKHLRDMKIPSPRKRNWNESNVTDVLENEAYAGSSVLHVDGEIIRARDAWPAVIGRTLWAEVEGRLSVEIAANVRRRASLGITARSRARRCPVTRPDYAWLAEADVAAATAIVRNELGDALSADDQNQMGSAICFAVSFPRESRRGVYWNFPIDRSRDATIGLGFSVSPDPRLVAIYFLDHGKIKAAAVHPAAFATRGRYRPMEIGKIRRAVRFHVSWPKVTARVLAAVLEMPLLDVPRLARRLNWDEDRTRYVCLKLKKRGVHLPPARIQPGRVIEVVCHVCGRIRSMPPSRALLLQTDKCARCCGGRADGLPATVAVTCPHCHVERTLYRCAYLRKPEGSEWPCHSCDVRVRTTIRHAARRPMLLRRAALLDAVAAVVEAKLRMNYAAYHHVRMRSRKSPTGSPEIYWTSDDRTRARLILRATDEVVESATTVDEHAARASDAAEWMTAPAGRGADVTYNYSLR
jgi:DNA invertase Pin-like site-specific DNA recombinase